MCSSKVRIVDGYITDENKKSVKSNILSDLDMAEKSREILPFHEKVVSSRLERQKVSANPKNEQP